MNLKLMTLLRLYLLWILNQCGCAAAACGGDLLGNGTITSPNYPSSYDSNSECTWLLQAADGDGVHLFFTHFELEPYADNLLIYQLFNGTPPQIYNVYTGSSTGTDLYLSNRVMIRFLSDTTDNRNGFSIAFTSASSLDLTTSSSYVTPISTTSAGCGGPLSGSGTIFSPGYPAAYPSSVRCTWYLRALSGESVQLDFLDFDLENNYDWLAVYNSYTSSADAIRESFTGSGPNGQRLYGNVVTIVFTSDSSVEGRGFNIKFSSVFESTQSTTSATTSECGGTFFGEGSFMSPNYPRTYPNNILCEWRVTANPGTSIKIEILNFALEPNRDFLRLYDVVSSITFETPFTEYTGIVQPTTVILGEQAIALFISDASGALEGFRVRFSSFNTTPTTPVTPVSNACGGWIYASGYIMSPGYPAAYPTNVLCEWKLRPRSGRKLLFQFIDFMLEQPWDALTVTRGTRKSQIRYSGYRTGAYAIFDGNVTATFISDESLQFRGFKIKVSSVKAVAFLALPRPKLLPDEICGVPAVRAVPLTTRIIGGTPVASGSIPWQARLRFGEAAFCGGSLITTRWVVTAAHCFDQLQLGNLSLLTVDLGLTSPNASNETYVRAQVKNVIVYPNYYKLYHNNDIALIELRTPATFSNRIRPICLPVEDVSPGKLCYASGWGLDNDSTLKQVPLPIVKRSSCDRYVASRFTKSMLCAGWIQGGKDTCQGDSGGPLACEQDGRFFLQGITSWGSGCGNAFSPGVYTRVFGYVNWIKSVISGR